MGGLQTIRDVLCIAAIATQQPRTGGGNSAGVAWYDLLAPGHQAALPGMRKLVGISFVIVDIKDEPRPAYPLGNQGSETIDGLRFAQANHIGTTSDSVPR